MDSENNTFEQCRYYKGEEECPYKDDIRRLFWGCEKKFIEGIGNRGVSPYMEYCIDDYYMNAKLSTYKIDDGVPLPIKMLLYNRITHWFQCSTEDFKRIYEQNYLGGDTKLATAGQATGN